MLPARRGAWRLLHDSACDGGVKHAKFHELCDGKGARVPPRPPPNHLHIGKRARAGHTVVVLKDKKGSIYGGYIDGVWQTKGFGTSDDAFMFCLASCEAPAAAPFKMPLNGTDNKHAIYGYAGCGAQFGGGPDFKVESDGHVTNKIGHTYTPGPLGATISGVARVAVESLEVWQLAEA